MKNINCQILILKGALFLLIIILFPIPSYGQPSLSRTFYKVCDESNSVINPKEMIAIVYDAIIEGEGFSVLPCVPEITLIYNNQIMKIEFLLPKDCYYYQQRLPIMDTIPFQAGVYQVDIASAFEKQQTLKDFQRIKLTPNDLQKIDDLTLDFQTIDLKEALCWAIQAGNVDMVKSLLEIKGQPIALAELLDTAIRYNNYEATHLLISLGANINPVPLTFLLICWKEASDNDIPKLLIESGLHLNERNSERKTALDYAIMANNSKIVKMLLDAGTNLELEPEAYLKEAVIWSEREVAQMLIEAGLNPNTLIGDPPISIATKALQEFLKKSGIFGDGYRQGYTSSSIAWLSKIGADINTRFCDSQGIEQTGIISAVQWGNVEVVKLFLELGANPNLKDSKGMTALDHALDRSTNELYSSKDLYPYKEVMALLKNKAASKNAK